MIVLAYLWPLAVIPLLVEKQDPEVQWHAKHGIVLMIAELAVLFAYMLLTSIVTVAAFGLGCILSLFLVFVWVGILALARGRHHQGRQRRTPDRPRTQRLRESFLERWPSSSRA